MINIASTPSLAWPAASAVQVAPVVPANAVGPAQASARDSGAGTGFGQGGQPAQATRTRRTEAGTETAAPAPAPLLPRSQGESADQPVDAREQLEADKRQAEEQAQELAKEQALQQQLREVLTNVWQASAAVVERALASDDDTSAAAVAGALPGTDAAGDPVAVVAAPPVALPDGGASAGAVPEAARGSEPEAYDEHGNSSWAPAEVGALIDQRV